MSIFTYISPIFTYILIIETEKMKPFLGIQHWDDQEKWNFWEQLEQLELQHLGQVSDIPNSTCKV